MVRFIIFSRCWRPVAFVKIYIPLWLDLLLKAYENNAKTRGYLHSTMVRFIMNEQKIAIEGIIGIYIPLWLDLLFS